MKIKNVTKTVKCEMCDSTQADESEFRAPHGHTMLVVSIWDEEKKKRLYMDFCSKECVAKWCNTELSDIRPKQPTT